MTRAAYIPTLNFILSIHLGTRDLLQNLADLTVQAGRVSSRLSEWRKPCLDVDDARDNAGLGMMCTARIAVALGHDAKPLAPTYTVLDTDAEAAEPQIVFLVVAIQFAPLRLLVGYVDVRMFLVVALIGAVGIDTRSLRQLHPGTPDRQVMSAARVRRRDARRCDPLW